MHVPRICLVSSTPPDHRGIGAIFLRDLCNSYPEGMISVIALCNSEYEPAPVSANATPIMHLPPPVFSSVIRALSYKIGIIGRIDFVRKYKIGHIKKTAKIIRQTIRELSIDKLWMVLNSNYSILLAAELCSSISVPLIVNVWDPITSNSKWESLDAHSRDSVLFAFHKVLKTVQVCGVASESMGRYYSDIYGIDTVTLIHGLPRSLWRKEIAVPPTETNINIGFAGTMYAKNEWNTLLRVLEDFSSRLKLTVMTKNFSVNIQYPVRIEFLGWRSSEDTVNKLADCDILYLPYWFSNTRDESVKLCFPNKMSTYLAAGKPVLYHGPSNSSPSEFLTKYRVGIECNSNNNIDDLMAAIMCFVENKAFYKEFSSERMKALERELSQEVFYRQFAKFMSIPFDTLNLPLDINMKGVP